MIIIVADGSKQHGELGHVLSDATVCQAIWAVQEHL